MSTPPRTSAPPARRPSLWRQRDFVAVWSGQVVSRLGSRTASTALPLLVLALTGSPGTAGLAGAAATLPYLVAHLPAGVLVDRVDRRRVMLVSQIAATVAAGSVPVAMLAGRLTVVHLVIVAFALGACSVCYELAEEAALPALVPAGLLPAALAQNEAKGRGAALAGPPLGGLLFGLGRVVPFLADAVSYLAATIGVLLVRRDLRPRRDTPPGSPLADTRDGLRFLWQQPFLRTSTLLIAVSNGTFQAFVLILVVVARGHGASAAAVGLMYGIYGGGGLLGALLAARLHRLFRPRLVAVGAQWLWTALIPLAVFTANPVLLGLLGGATAFVGPLWNVVLGTHSYAIVPDAMRGRVSSASLTIAWGAQPLGALAGGWLLQSAGPTTTLLAFGAVMLAAAIAGTASRGFRDLPPLPA